jgi:1-acyl-sn-glycerol-3-phosphate acyltransferase
MVTMSDKEPGSNQFRMMFERRFVPLWLCNTLGEFSNQLARAATAGLLAGYALTTATAGELRGMAATIFVIAAIMAAPFGGQLADRVAAHRLISLSRLVGLAGAVLAALGVWFGIGWAVITGLCIAAVQAAVFGPARGVLLRKHLSDSELTGGNGLLTAGWQLTAVAALAIGLLEPTSAGVANKVMVGMLVATAATAWLASLALPVTEAPAPGMTFNWNPLKALRSAWVPAVSERGTFLAILGISWFWFTSLTYMIYLPDYANADFGAGRDAAMAMLAILLVGIAAGALICAPLSGRRVELGLVPLGAIGILATGLDFYFNTPASPLGASMSLEAMLGSSVYRRSMLDLFLMGAATGLFVVPLYAVIQQRAKPGQLGRVLGGMYLFNLLFITVSLAAAEWLHRHGVAVSTLMLGTTLLHAAASVYIFLLLPEFLLRLVMWVLIHTVYRVRASGMDNIPENGPAVIVSNHVTYIDPLLIGARVRRPIRFVMHKHIFQIPIMATLFRLNKAIPIVSGRTDPEGLKAALDLVAAELEAGQLVVIFPEGHLTRDGDIDTFRSGVEQMVARTPVPVIPVAVQGLWGSFFSNFGGTALTHWPRFSWSRIGLVAGEAVPPDLVSAADLQQRVLKLRGDRK